MSLQQARKHIRGTLHYVAAELRMEEGAQQVRTASLSGFQPDLILAADTRIRQLRAAYAGLHAALAAIPP